MRMVVPLMTTDFLFISHIIWARSLAGKAPRSQRGDREFESLRVHQKGTPCVSLSTGSLCTFAEMKGLNVQICRG